MFDMTIETGVFTLRLLGSRTCGPVAAHITHLGGEVIILPTDRAMGSPYVGWARGRLGAPGVEVNPTAARVRQVVGPWANDLAERVNSLTTAATEDAEFLRRLAAVGVLPGEHLRRAAAAENFALQAPRRLETFLERFAAPEAPAEPPGAILDTSKDDLEAAEA